jgi:hypothetical protein
LLLAASFSATAVAQVGTGPGYTKVPSPSFIIIKAFNSVPGDDVRHVHFVKLSNNPAGQWTAAVTSQNLQFYVGSGTGVGVMIGLFDPFLGTFTPTIPFQAQNLNSTLDDNHLTLSPDGLWAILERSDGNVYLGSRANVNAQFGTPVAVTGFGALTDVYPNLAKVGGQWKCFYTDQTHIVMQDINLVTASLTGSPTIVANAVVPNARPISPTPVIGADGDAEGLWASDQIVPKTLPFTGNADPVWHNDLDPSTPGVVQEQNPDWQCCGGLAGGFIYFSHDITPNWHVMHGEGAWMIGDSEAIGGSADILTAGVHKSSPNPLFSTLLFGAAEGPPLSIPPFQGRLGLQPVFPVTVTFGTTSRDGIASISFGIPNDPGLQGLSLPLQAAVTNFVVGTLVFTNTAWLHIQ